MDPAPVICESPNGLWLVLPWALVVVAILAMVVTALWFFCRYTILSYSREKTLTVTERQIIPRSKPLDIAWLGVCAMVVAILVLLGVVVVAFMV